MQEIRIVSKELKKMSNRITEKKAFTIARSYISANCDKAAALVASGYTKKYAASPQGQAVFDDPVVIQAIQTVSSEIADSPSAESAAIVKQLKSIAFAKDKTPGINCSDRNKALELLGKRLDLFTGVTAAMTQQQRELSASQEHQARAIAHILNHYKPQIDEYLAANAPIEEYTDADILEGNGGANS